MGRHFSIQRGLCVSETTMSHPLGPYVYSTRDLFVCRFQKIMADKETNFEFQRNGGVINIIPLVATPFSNGVYHPPSRSFASNTIFGYSEASNKQRESRIYIFQAIRGGNRLSSSRLCLDSRMFQATRVKLRVSLLCQITLLNNLAG